MQSAVQTRVQVPIRTSTGHRERTVCAQGSLPTRCAAQLVINFTYLCIIAFTRLPTVYIIIAAINIIIICQKSLQSAIYCIIDLAIYDLYLSLSGFFALVLCSQAPEVGFCRGYFPRFFHNSTSNQCEKFIYGGCGGNANKFRTLSQCQQTCSELVYNG